MTPVAERPDKAMALRLIDDLGKVKTDNPRTIDASVFLLEQNLYLTDRVEGMPEEVSDAVLDKLNGKVGTAIKQELPIALTAHMKECQASFEKQEHRPFWQEWAIRAPYAAALIIVAILVLYYMSTGKVPFSPTDAIATIEHIEGAK